MMTMTPAFNGVVDVVLIDISNKIDFSCSLNLLVHFYFLDAPQTVVCYLLPRYRFTRHAPTGSFLHQKHDDIYKNTSP